MKILLLLTVIFILCDAMGSLTPAVTFYRLHDLADLGRDFSTARGINSSGQVVGYSNPASGTIHPLLWDPATREMLALGDLGGNGVFHFSLAAGINSSGQVVGHSLTRTGADHAFLWDPATREMLDLGHLGGNFSQATAINARGQVVGYSYNTTGAARAFLWDPSTLEMQDLGHLGWGDGNWESSYATGINSSGQVVGYYFTSPGISHAFLWDPSTREMQDLTENTGNHCSYATGINDSGQVVGWTCTGPGPSGYHEHAFLWDPATHKVQDLGSLAGENGRSRAFAISSRGQVVGQSTSASGKLHAFLWDPSTDIMQDLNESILSGDQEISCLVYASGINDDGLVACTAIKKDHFTAVLAMPTIGSSAAWVRALRPSTMRKASCQMVHARAGGYGRIEQAAQL